MINYRHFDQAMNIWKNWSLLGKHLFCVVVCFFGIGLIVALGKLGFHDLGMTVTALEAPLAFWTFGGWYAVKGVYRLILFIYF